MKTSLLSSCLLLLTSLVPTLARAEDTAPVPGPAPAPAGAPAAQPGEAPLPPSATGTATSPPPPATAPAPGTAPVENPLVPLAAMPNAAPQPTGPAFTLEQALADSAKLNDTTAIATARLSFAIAERTQAKALVLPTISADGSYTNTSYSSHPWGHGPVQSIGGEIDLSMTLFNPAAYPALRGAKIAVYQQRYLSEDLRRQLAFEVTLSYLQAITSERNTAAAMQILAVTKESLRESEASAKVGLKSYNDATRAELDVANAQLAYTNDQQAVVSARLSLGDLVGHEVPGALVDPRPAELPNGDEPMMEDLATRTRPDLQSNVLQIQIEDEAIQTAKNLYLPSFGLLAGYADRHYNPYQVDASPSFPSWSVAVTANWTLYDGGSRLGQVDANKALRDEASASEHSARVDLHRDLCTAISNLATQNSSVAQAQVSVHVAQVNADEVKTKYQQGLSTQLDVSDANSELFSAEVNLIGAQLSYASARFQIRSLVGWWPLVVADPSPDSSRLHCGTVK